VSHWYDATGRLYAHVENKSRPGELRDFTLADARKHPERLYPSVTTYLSAVNKEMVNLWRIEQGIRAVLTEPITGDEDWERYIRRMVSKADEYSRRAADFGAEIHNTVCNLLGGRRPERQDFIMSRKIAEGVCFWLEASGYEVLETEHTFVNERLGYAGTIDLKVRRRGKIVRLDIKTNSFKTERECPFYPEHRYQLAGYALGEEADPEDEREVLYVSRETMNLIVPRLCTEPSKDDRAFMAIKELWHATHDY
jgi:ATP-dependent exoDNAse (exonuclease V) beta subunit